MRKDARLTVLISREETLFNLGKLHWVARFLYYKMQNPAECSGKKQNSEKRQALFSSPFCLCSSITLSLTQPLLRSSHPPFQAKTMDHTDRTIYRPGFPRESLTPLVSMNLEEKLPVYSTQLESAHLVTSEMWEEQMSYQCARVKTEKQKCDISINFRDDQLTCPSDLAPHDISSDRGWMQMPWRLLGL